eukprot:Skav207433  [mRNA]  locus=scaffold1798:160109:165893:- [translate_table: standard]
MERDAAKVILMVHICSLLDQQAQGSVVTELNAEAHQRHAPLDVEPLVIGVHLVIHIRSLSQHLLQHLGIAPQCRETRGGPAELPVKELLKAILSHELLQLCFGAGCSTEASSGHGGLQLRGSRLTRVVGPQVDVLQVQHHAIAMKIGVPQQGKELRLQHPCNKPSHLVSVAFHGKLSQASRTEK